MNRCGHGHLAYKFPINVTVPERRSKVAVSQEARFIEIPRERRSYVPFTEAQLTAMRGGLTAEEYRWRLIRKWCKAQAD